ncbi:TetR/AcrR family transcriptional regulator [Flocculibacter collagenilyticus]|uniref:TetR/AcrR family transcriptional regulator n=1 Tax=Flocculibacter collagenilyticus TaxID=2744479 RepID=UPI0018F75DA9|nr:TetR/AcrR family transcriptional regulator [Flocculibacter collagenilyticus]
MVKAKYHHGDLNKSLLEAATQIIKENGVDSLSMRKLADKVGVSRTAPYHHFKDKNALLCAIAAAGFNKQIALLKRYTKTDDTDSSASDSNNQQNNKAVFEEYVMAYIEFANKNSATYDLMFGKEIWKLGQPSDALKHISKQSFQSWVQWIGDLQKANVLASEESALRMAQVCWATLHGLSRLLNDGVYEQSHGLSAMAKITAKMLTTGLSSHN